MPTCIKLHFVCSVTEYTESAQNHASLTLCFALTLMGCRSSDEYPTLIDAFYHFNINKTTQDVA